VAVFLGVVTQLDLLEAILSGCSPVVGVPFTAAWRPQHRHLINGRCLEAV